MFDIFSIFLTTFFDLQKSIGVSQITTLALDTHSRSYSSLKCNNIQLFLFWCEQNFDNYFPDRTYKQILFTSFLRVFSLIYQTTIILFRDKKNFMFFILINNSNSRFTTKTASRSTCFISTFRTTLLPFSPKCVFTTFFTKVCVPFLFLLNTLTFVCKNIDHHKISLLLNINPLILYQFLTLLYCSRYLRLSHLSLHVFRSYIICTIVLQSL